MHLDIISVWNISALTIDNVEFIRNQIIDHPFIQECDLNRNYVIIKKVIVIIVIYAAFLILINVSVMLQVPIVAVLLILSLFLSISYLLLGSIQLFLLMAILLSVFFNTFFLFHLNLML